MPNPMDSLQTLLRMKTPQQVQTNDPWLARRQGEIASGLDEFLPDADSPDYKYDQMEKGAKYGVSLPRADTRSGHMAQLRQMLGLKEQEYQQKLRQAELEGQYSLAAEQGKQFAENERTRFVQGETTKRSDADRGARSEIAENRIRDLEARDAARNAAAFERTKYGADATTARAKRPFNLLQWLLNGGEDTPEAPQAAPNAAPAPDASPLGAGDFEYIPGKGYVRVG